MSSQQATTAALAPSGSNIKRLSTVNKQGGSPGKKAPQPVNVSSNIKDVVSPGELCGFVDSLLNNLETRFDDMSEQILSRMNDMSARIDNLENSIQDLMHDGIDGSPIKR